MRLQALLLQVTHDMLRENPGSPLSAAVDDAASMPPEAWALVHARRLNILVVGPDEATGPFLDTLRSHCSPPVIEVSPHEPLDLPDAADAGTLLVRDLGSLNAGSQSQLAEWLARSAGRTQVISTSPVPVLPMIEAGEFAERLYYRLNTVYVDLTPLVLSDVIASNR